jgi:hypothetical protein
MEDVLVINSVADPGCFILDPRSGSERFSIPDPDQNIFHSGVRIPDPTYKE